MLKTPESINSNVRNILKKLPNTAEPIYVPVRVEQDAIQDECFLNVEKKILKDSGSIVVGWAVWENAFLIEGEHHSVWKSDSGELVDVTPKSNNESRILFVPNANGKFEGIQKDNIRLNISGNQLVDDFIELFKARYRLLNKGERKNQLGEVILSGKDASLYQTIEMLIQGVQWMLSNNNTRMSLCFCGSGTKYKKCHGQDLMSTLRRI